ncbi:uncharacterized protein YndB with AHSA1/START domain [Arthrobacter pigmenti]|uniref:Uncharacterized protein YndB with AHSA1/START domain n=1 Tax=Arthrobacter pigmenti TaxID=271432 RepID=A0A846RKT8_9MICC|nr:SRPBCC domain-containing protein [Arthrobacter pigmenti]NJC21272.1 uncharacterized protein YndB with AHSA1/START domain [Arthrobacter pigmenti]
MSDLFSHADPLPPADDSAPAARTVAVHVPAEIERAWAGFTEYIHLWWPAAYSGYGEGTHVAFEDGLLLEENEEGTQQVWARIRETDPPRMLELSWVLAGDPTQPTRVSVQLESIDEGTTVTLVHDGWASGSGGSLQYEKYSDWQAILAQYRRFMGGAV